MADISIEYSKCTALYLALYLVSESSGEDNGKAKEYQEKAAISKTGAYIFGQAAHWKESDIDNLIEMDYSILRIYVDYKNNEKIKNTIINCVTLINEPKEILKNKLTVNDIPENFIDLMNR